MNTRTDLDDLREAWQGQRATPLDVAALHEQARADLSNHNRALLVAALLTVAVLGVMLARAMLMPHPETWFGLAWTTLFTAVVWPVSLWLSRGTWRPRDESTVAHLEVCIRRCRAMQAAAPVGIALYLAGLASALVMRHRLFGGEWSELLASPAVIIAGWLGAPLYAAGMLWFARRQKGRLAAFEALRRQLTEG